MGCFNLDANVVIIAVRKNCVDLFLGQTVGSVVDVKAPAGNIKYKIIDIKK